MTQHLEMFKPQERGPDDTSAFLAEILSPTKSNVPAALSEELRSTAARVRERLGSVTANVIEVGRELIAVKNRVQHGQFIHWVETACGLSRRMAQLMMRAAQWLEGKSETVTLLELRRFTSLPHRRHQRPSRTPFSREWTQAR